MCLLCPVIERPNPGPGEPVTPGGPPGGGGVWAGREALFPRLPAGTWAAGGGEGSGVGAAQDRLSCCLTQLAA